MTNISTWLNEVRARLDTAHKEICGLSSGDRKWLMCIPVQPTDSDMILQAPLDDLRHALEIIEDLQLHRQKIDSLYSIGEMNQLRAQLAITVEALEYYDGEDHVTAVAREALARISDISGKGGG